MLARVPLRGCCRPGRPRQSGLLALLVLKNAQWARNSTSVRAYSSEHAHHEARIESVRNIGIIAHVDAVRAGLSLSRPPALPPPSLPPAGWSLTPPQGKTTTTERMLFHSGRTRHIGSTSVQALL